MKLRFRGTYPPESGAGATTIPPRSAAVVFPLGGAAVVFPLGGAAVEDESLLPAGGRSDSHGADTVIARRTAANS